MSSPLQGLGPDATLERARAAVAQARSVRVVGKAGGDAPVRVAVALASGTGGRGTLQVGARRFNLILVGDDLYIRAARPAMKAVTGASDEILDRIGSKYARVSASDPRYADLADTLRLAPFTGRLLATSGPLTSVPGRTIDGVAAVGVADGSTTGSTIYVGDVDPPYPLLIESRTASTPGSFRLSGWDEPVTVTAPDAGSVVALTPAP